MMDYPRRAACNLFALRQAARSVTILYDRHLAKAGLTSSQHSILVAINMHPGSTMQDLADNLVMDRTALLRALKPLSQEGYVRQHPSPEHARRLVLSLTAAGKAKVLEARPHWQRAQDEFEAQMGSEESQALRTILLSIPHAK